MREPLGRDGMRERCCRRAAMACSLGMRLGCGSRERGCTSNAGFSHTATLSAAASPPLLTRACSPSPASSASRPSSHSAGSARARRTAVAPSVGFLLVLFCVFNVFAGPQSVAPHDGLAFPCLHAHADSTSRSGYARAQAGCCFSRSCPIWHSTRQRIRVDHSNKHSEHQQLAPFGQRQATRAGEARRCVPPAQEDSPAPTMLRFAAAAHPALPSAPGRRRRAGAWALPGCPARLR